MGAATKVVVAMSGGVDSSVAAALLVHEGHDVTGVTLDVWPADQEAPDSAGSCCGLAAAEDARRVCHKLGIPHYVLNFRRVFAERVIDHFCSEYLAGRTPNPCIRCNERIKFDVLLRRASELGASHLATGHYARICRTGDGALTLRRAVDRDKDQSYVVYAIGQEKMRKVMFPLGGMTKDQVRETAREAGMRVADKPESQEICFVPDGRYADFVRSRAPSAGPGVLVATDGTEVGTHEGIESYTIGQRRGLGSNLGGPKYVVGIDASGNRVVVGDERDLYALELIASEAVWCSSVEPRGRIEVSAKVRYRMDASRATVEPMSGDRLLVRFEEPQRAITPGQAVVFYDGDIVLGGATIVEVPDRWVPKPAKAALGES